TAESHVDSLTGLRGRINMDKDLERELARFARDQQPFCIAVGDIDHFKTINDDFGHDAGDKILHDIASIINRSIRSFDDAYRFGGEEFLICLKGADITDGFVVIDRLRREIADRALSTPSGEEINTTMSFGVVQMAQNMTVETMI